MERRIIIIVVFTILLSGCDMDLFDYLEDRVAGLPDEPASDVSFTDTDMQQDEIGGNIIISRAEKESNITDYGLYWGSDEETKLGERIAELEKTGEDLSFTIEADTIKMIFSSSILALIIKS